MCMSVYDLPVRSCFGNACSCMSASIAKCAAVQCSGCSQTDLLCSPNCVFEHVHDDHELTDTRGSELIKDSVFCVKLHGTLLQYGQAFIMMIKALPDLLAHCRDALVAHCSCCNTYGSYRMLMFVQCSQEGKYRLHCSLHDWLCGRVNR